MEERSPARGRRGPSRSSVCQQQQMTREPLDEAAIPTEFRDKQGIPAPRPTRSRGCPFPTALPAGLELQVGSGRGGEGPDHKITGYPELEETHRDR